MEEKNQKLDQIDHLLGSIQRVNAPEFLETRIQARLNQQLDIVPTWWAWTSAAFVAVLLLINISVLQFGQATNNGADILVDGMHLIDDYNLYSN